MTQLSGALVCLLVALPAASQTVEDIVAKNAEARGGVARLQAVQSVRVVAHGPFGRPPENVLDRTLASQDTAVMITEYKRPNLFRQTILLPGFSQLQYEQALRDLKGDARSPATREGLKALSDEASRGDFSIPAVSLIMASDGTTAWTWNSHQRKLLTRAADRTEGVGLDGPLVGLHARGDRIELAGTAKVDGKRCYKLRATSKSGDVVTLYVDVGTYLEVAVEATPKPGPMGGIPLRTRTIYRDWQAMDGIMVAHTLVISPGDGPNQTQTIDKVEFNVPLGYAARKVDQYAGRKVIHPEGAPFYSTSSLLHLSRSVDEALWELVGRAFYARSKPRWARSVRPRGRQLPQAVRLRASPPFAACASGSSSPSW